MVIIYFYFECLLTVNLPVPVPVPHRMHWFIDWSSIWYYFVFNSTPTRKFWQADQRWAGPSGLEPAGREQEAPQLQLLASSRSYFWQSGHHRWQFLQHTKYRSLDQSQFCSRWHQCKFNQAFLYTRRNSGCHKYITYCTADWLRRLYWDVIRWQFQNIGSAAIRNQYDNIGSGHASRCSWLYIRMRWLSEMGNIVWKHWIQSHLQTARSDL